jgi:hypothetical protein
LSPFSSVSQVDISKSTSYYPFYRNSEEVVGAIITLSDCCRSTEMGYFFFLSNNRVRNQLPSTWIKQN